MTDRYAPEKLAVARARLAICLTSATFLVLSACGNAGGQSDSDIGGSTPGSSATMATNKALPIALPSNPIVWAEVSGEVPPEIISIDPCPFLTDQTAIDGVSTNLEFKRRHVSNERCVWNYNIGFEISVKIQAETDARPRSQRTYNLDNPPVIDTQDGPGADAVLFLDPTWNPETPRPYAFAFGHEGQEIMITTVGSKTSPQQLRRVADEVFQRLPGAVSIEPQNYLEIPAFDPCSVWSKEQLIEVYGWPAGTNASTRAMGRGACAYEFYPENAASLKLQTGLSECGAEFLQTRRDQGFEDVAGFDVPVVTKISEESWGADVTLDAIAAPVCVQMYSSGNSAPPDPNIRAGMEVLLNNALARLQFAEGEVR